MTKVLIVSDSHGWKDELLYIKSKHQDAAVMIHCGDSELIATDEAMQGFITVRGNCDYEKAFPEEAVVEVAGQKIFVTHGHCFNVKSSLMGLNYRAKELNATIACFGHSHLLGFEKVNGILFINPGSIRLPKGRSEHTYVVLEIKDNGVDLLVFDLQKGEIRSLRQQFPI